MTGVTRRDRKPGDPPPPETRRVFPGLTEPFTPPWWPPLRRPQSDDFFGEHASIRESQTEPALQCDARSAARALLTTLTVNIRRVAAARAGETGFRLDRPPGSFIAVWAAPCSGPEAGLAAPLGCSRTDSFEAWRIPAFNAQGALDPCRPPSRIAAQAIDELWDIVCECHTDKDAPPPVLLLSEGALRCADALAAYWAASTPSYLNSSDTETMFRLNSALGPDALVWPWTLAEHRLRGELSGPADPLTRHRAAEQSDRSLAALLAQAAPATPGQAIAAAYTLIEMIDEAIAGGLARKAARTVLGKSPPTRTE